MPAPIDITNQRFGKLVAKKYSHSTREGRMYECQCDCGNTGVWSVPRLRSGRTKGCGKCKEKPKGSAPEDLLNQRFGKLVAKEFLRTNKYGAVWLCQCDCGNTKEAEARKLKQGQNKSCGCYIPKRCYRHGCAVHGKETKAYKAWSHMKTWNKISYPERWEKFENFLKDIGDAPNEECRLSLRDYRKPHSKTNTYWKNPYEREELEPEPILNMRGLGS